MQGGPPEFGHDAAPRATAACFFCAAIGLPGRTCASCLVRIPDPAIAHVPVRPECPRCRAPFLAIGIDRDGSVLHGCSSCHGLFLPPRAWCALVARPALAADVERRLPGRGVPASALLDLVPCPGCARQMERGRFAASSSVVIDVCPDHGVWLDAGELGAVVRHAARRASGEATSAEPAAVIVRYAGGGPEPARRASGLTWVKRVLGGIALLLLLSRVLYVMSGRGANMSNHGHDSARAAEGASTALGR
ncbi:MAG: zf-TFIIB domain-containing protein [Labilithrix sp.]|nr:zf-TFIIB domain-containing protein [Labilithrix sp.]